MHLLGYAYPVWEAWETSRKGNMVYAQHPATLGRKGLFEAVTEGAQFLGSPYLNVSMQSTQHLPVSNSPGEGSWWGAWTTVLAGWPQRAGISGQQQVIGFGSLGLRNNLCNLWTPWNACAIPFLHAHLSYSLLLLSGVSFVVVPCAWRVMPWHCVNMNQCYILVLITF